MGNGEKESSCFVFAPQKPSWFHSWYSIMPCRGKNFTDYTYTYVCRSSHMRHDKQAERFTKDRAFILNQTELSSANSWMLIYFSKTWTWSADRDSKAHLTKTSRFLEGKLSSVPCQMICPKQQSLVGATQAWKPAPRTSNAVFFPISYETKQIISKRQCT